MLKSVITCDMEGRIETFNSGAEIIFGYDAEEVIGKARVSLFSPGEIVLEHVPFWLQKASEEGEHITKTKFVRKDGSTFNARIRITPTFQNGKSRTQSGYCGVTEVIDEEVDVPISFQTKLIKGLVITRLPFISAALMPVLIGGAFAYRYVLDDTSSFNTGFFLLTLLGVILLHLGSNVLNDYFDVKSGTDGANNDYFLQYSGGSRAIELGLINLESTRKLGFALLGFAGLIGLYLSIQTGLTTFLLGMSGLLIGYLYTAPPVRLVARKGLGELGIALAFGPLITEGTVYVLTQQIDFMTFLIGLPVGLLTANILLINEFPDAKGDAVTGKNHLVVSFGKNIASYIYLGIVALAFIAHLGMLNALPGFNILLMVIASLSMLVGVQLFTQIRKFMFSRELVTTNKRSIALSAITGLLTAIALLI